MIGDMRTTRNDTTAWRTLAKGDADERDRNSARFWLSWRGEDVGARFYNRAGEPITQDEWRDLWGEGDEVRRVAYDPLGHRKVSTAWVGMDHSEGAEVPLIFETLVSDADGAELHYEYYATEQAAREGHAWWVRRMTA